MAADIESSDEVTTSSGVVVENVLAKFLDALAAKQDLADIAPRLRKLLLEDRIYAEPAKLVLLPPV